MAWYWPQAVTCLLCAHCTMHGFLRNCRWCNTTLKMISLITKEVPTQEVKGTDYACEGFLLSAAVRIFQSFICYQGHTIYTH